MRKYLAFALTGGVGFVVDAGLLYILIHWAGWSPLVGRIASIAAALLVTWQMNRNLTFGKSDHSVMREGMRYGAVGAASSLLNYGVFCALVLLIPDFPALAALTIASATATLFSWLGYSRLVFGNVFR
jgi:putative flippase GtrA